MASLSRSIVCLLAAAAVSCAVAASGFGRYVGEVKTKWLDDGRRMELLENFLFIGPDGVEWDAPKGWVIDGASIPQIAFSLVGGPYDKPYRAASVIHDVACDRKSRHWEDVHLAFFHAMRASGVSSVKAKVMYAAVYTFGPRWAREEVDVVSEQAAFASAQAMRTRLERAGIVEITVRDHYVEGVGASGRLERLPSGMKEVRARVEAPRNRMSAESFDVLRQRIEREDPPLESIRQLVSAAR